MADNEQAFGQRVADRAFEAIEQEWQERGAELGMEITPLAEIIELEAQRDGIATGTAGAPAPRPRPVVREADGTTRPAGRPRPTPIAPGRARPQPIPPDRTNARANLRRADQRAGAAPKRREYRVVQQREPVDLWIEPTDEELARDPNLEAELITVYVRRTPATEIPYLDRYEAMLIRLRHQMADLEIDGPKAQTKLDRLAGKYNALMEEMICFSVDMPDGTYVKLDTAALGYLQRVISEVSRPINDSDEDDDSLGNL